MDALEQNCSLLNLETDMDLDTLRLQNRLRFNRELVSAWKALAALSHGCQYEGFRNLTSWGFRARLLSYFMTPGCKAKPRFVCASESERDKLCVTAVAAQGDVDVSVGVELPAKRRRCDVR